MKTIGMKFGNYLVVSASLFFGVENANAQTWNQLGSDIIGESGGDQSGNSISINADGTVLAVGAELNSGPGAPNADYGHVRAFAWDGSDWVQRGADIDGEAQGDHAGISVDLDMEGNTLAVGAFGNDGASFNAGHARVFDWNGTSWQQKGANIEGENANDYFGSTVSLSADGNIIAIGAPLNDENGNSAGHVRIYQWNGSAWDQKGLDIDGEAAGDESGNAINLSADGNTIAIGAYLNDGNGSDAGQTRVYEWNGTTWAQKGVDIDGEDEFIHFGKSVELSADGNTLAAGAHRNDEAATLAGHVRVYEWNGTSWAQKGIDIDGEAAGDESGFALSLDSTGNTVAIGAYKNDGNTGNSGHARVYQWNGSSWAQKGMDIDGAAGDNYAGYSVSLEGAGNTLAVGAIRNDGNGTYSGHVRVYSSCTAVTGIDTRTECDSLVWIDGITYYTNNNTAVFNIESGASNFCDSLVTLNLTINSVSDLSTTLVGATLTANNTTAASYQWLDCDNGNSEITSETSIGYMPSANGNYAVEITENGCVDTSACVDVLTVGILDNGIEDVFSVYPNPTNGNFFIDLGENHDMVTISIADLRGRIIQTETIRNAQTINQTLNKPAGVYMLLINADGKTSTSRLVKE